MAIDQVTKWMAEQWLVPYPSTIELIPWRSILRLHYVKNPGAAFGLFPGQTVLLILVSLLVSGVCLWIMHVHTDQPISWPAVFLLAGGLGNMIDRLVRSGVVDFIDMGIGNYRWPTYNVADMFLVLGCFWLAKLIWFLELPWDRSGEGMGETVDRG